MANDGDDVMTLWVKKVYIVAFMLSIGLFYIWTSFSRPSVLVIHAFNPNNQITDKVSRGIDSVLSKRTYYHVYEHFMDLKNNNIKAVANKIIIVPRTPNQNFFCAVV